FSATPLRETPLDRAQSSGTPLNEKPIFGARQRPASRANFTGHGRKMSQSPNVRPAGGSSTGSPPGSPESRSTAHGPATAQPAGGAENADRKLIFRSEPTALDDGLRFPGHGRPPPPTDLCREQQTTRQRVKPERGSAEIGPNFRSSTRWRVFHRFTAWEPGKSQHGARTRHGAARRRCGKRRPVPARPPSALSPRRRSALPRPWAASASNRP